MIALSDQARRHIPTSVTEGPYRRWFGLGLRSILLGFSLLSLMSVTGILSPGTALAQDDARTRQLRLLCARLSGDLMDPGGIAAFRRCLTTHDPVGEIKRDTFGGPAPAQPDDRPGAEPPAGFGANARHLEAEGVERFRIISGRTAFAIDRDGTLWRWSLGEKQTVGVQDRHVADIFAGGGDTALVLDSTGALWREGKDATNKVLVDQAVADAQQTDPASLYVRGRDGKLWREDGDATHRRLVDANVSAFLVVGPETIDVLGSDGKLWRETGDFKTRSLIASGVVSFQCGDDGKVTYVLTSDGSLWRQTGSEKPELVDRDIAAVQPVDLNLAYVLGRDGRLWQELGTRDQSQLVDRQLMATLGPRAYYAIDGQHVLVLGQDHKLWSETMPSAR